MNYQECLGTWHNSHILSKGLKYVTFHEDAPTLSLNVEGMPNGLIPGKWENIPCKAYAKSKQSKQPIAFQANFQTEDFEAYLQFNINQNLFVIAMLLNFKKEENASDVFIREFFSQL